MQNKPAKLRPKIADRNERVEKSFRRKPEAAGSRTGPFAEKFAARL